MVLRHALFLLKFLFFLTICLFISACSSLNNQQRPAIVPVDKESLPNSPIDAESLNILNEARPTYQSGDSSPSFSPKQSSKQSIDLHEQEHPSDTNTSRSNILSVLLSKARQAINAQQWLRAQRVLEQAIRISPKNPLVFMEYGNLYQLMGGQEKAKTMYKRALYLGADQADLREQLREKLNTIK